MSPLIEDEQPEALPTTEEEVSGGRRLSLRYWRTLAFAAVALVAISGLVLSMRLVREPEPITLTEVEASVDALLAEVTPGPSYSVHVYDVILPSLVVIRINDFGPPGDSTAQRQLPLVPYAFADSDRMGSAHHQVRYGAPVQADTPVQELAPIGSGVIVSADGLILTAYHVLEGARAIDITFADGTESAASIISIVPDNNIAVLMPETLPEVFAPAILGNPGALRVGDDVYAVGNPLGLSGSISAGVVSGLDRTHSQFDGSPPLERLIQFDSAVNAGSGGGPLLNRDGEVVGIVVGPVNPTAQETFIGIGFAVRIDVASSAAGAPEL
jgi:S1-C subfamily serine protease